MAIMRRPVSQRRKARRTQYKATRRNRTRAYEPSTLMTRGTNPQNAVVFRGIGFPDRLTTNLVYADSFILDPSAGTPFPYTVWRMTSLYDPQYAIGGGQPTYFDQLALIYSRYKVNGAKITASFSLSTQTAANIGPYLCGIQMSDAITLPTNSPSAIMSSPNTISRLISKDDGTVSLVQTYSSRQTYPDFDDNLQSRTNNDPVINWLAKVWASPQGVDIEVPINCTIRIEYNATFSDVLQVVDA